MNSIPIRQSELDAAGLGNVRFASLGYHDRKSVASQVLLAAGRRQEAFLIQINNPNAVASIVYVDDRMRGVR
jgi:hypothetical protein